MPSFANIEILGHVGREPEQRYSQQGQMRCSFSVAVNPPGIRQPDGSYVDAPTDWFRVTCFGKTAERAVRDIVKGQSVHVRGRFKTDNWTGQDGQPRTTLDIAADSVTSLAPRYAEASNAPADDERNPANIRGNAPAQLEDLPF
jgi:single-strand DNA-binding protein